MISIQVSLDYPLQIRNTESQQRAQERVRETRKPLLFHCSSCRLKGCMCYAQVANLPMTTREPISDAKAREFLLPSSSWGSHLCSGYREEPQVLDYIAYIGSILGKKGFLGRGTSDWSLSFEGFCVGS